MAKTSLVNDVEKANKLHVEPRSPNQEKYLESLYEKDQIFGIGPAGTGKTFLATCVGVDLYLRQKYKKLIVTRPAVEVGERHGFLPGKLEQKLAPWLIPIVDVASECMGKGRLEDGLKNGSIQTVPLSHMRGRTFDDAIIIIDEAQNTTVEQMKMFLTRIGERSKVIINGDIEQSDLSKNNGLAYVMGLIRSQNLPVAVVEFEACDVQRSTICQMWVDAFATSRLKLAS